MNEKTETDDIHALEKQLELADELIEQLWEKCRISFEQDQQYYGGSPYSFLERRYQDWFKLVRKTDPKGS